MSSKYEPLPLKKQEDSALGDDGGPQIDEGYQEYQETEDSKEQEPLFQHGNKHSSTSSTSRPEDAYPTVDEDDWNQVENHLKDFHDKLSEAEKAYTASLKEEEEKLWKSKFIEARDKAKHAVGNKTNDASTLMALLIEKGKNDLAFELAEAVHHSQELYCTPSNSSAETSRHSNSTLPPYPTSPTAIKKTGKPLHPAIPYSDATLIQSYLTDHDEKYELCAYNQRGETVLHLAPDKEVQRLVLPFILQKIIASKSFATHHTQAGVSWLHCLATMQYIEAYKGPMQIAVKRVLDLGVSPYARVKPIGTAFRPIRQADAYGLATLFCEHEDHDVVGAKEHIYKIDRFIQSILDNPTNKMQKRLLILSGLSGLESRLAKSRSESKGYQLIQDEPNQNDKFVNAIQARYVATFKKLKVDGTPRCYFIRNIDKLVAERTDSLSGSCHNFSADVAQLHTEIAALVGHTASSFVIATADSVNNLDRKILSSAEIVHFSLPSREERLQYLTHQLRFVLFEEDSLLNRLADASSGFSYDSLDTLITSITALPFHHCSNEDAMRLFKATQTQMVQKAYDKYEINIVPPSLKSIEGHLPLQNYTGIKPEQEKVYKQAYHMLIDEEVSKYHQRGINQYNILLAGPPGVGKTLLARELSNDANCMFITLGSSDYTPDTLKNVFGYAKSFEKVVIFMDEIDSIVFNEAAVKILQTELDGFKKQEGILVSMAATNYPEKLPPAIQDRF